MMQSIKYGVVVVLATLLAACSRNKSELVVKLPKKKDVELLDAMDSIADQSYSSFYSKISTKYSDSSQNVSFKTSVRMVGDSATNFMITFARIPVVHALLTNDSVQVSNKREKCYVKESLSYIKEQFAVDFELKDIENLVQGVPVSYNPEYKYYQVESSKGYTLCSHNKRGLKKIEKGNLKEIVMYYSMNPELTELTSTTIVSPEDSTEIFIDYRSRELIGDVLMPKEAAIRITTPDQEINIILEYKKTRINQGEKIHFIIPESYEECK
jgi:hypothetical protein